MTLELAFEDLIRTKYNTLPKTSRRGLKFRYKKGELSIDTMKKMLHKLGYAVIQPERWIKL